MLQDFDIYSKPLSSLPEGRLLINTINAHSYNVSREDAEFKEALLASDVLIPDGVSVVWAVRMLTPRPPKGGVRQTLKKIAGEDLFYWEMRRLQLQAVSGKQKVAKAMFLGSTEEVLAKIKARAAVEFPNVEVHTYSPPYKAAFSDDDNRAMYAAIEAVQPDVLFVGMTAPKQEKWAFKLVYPQPLKGSKIDEMQQNNSPLGVRGNIHVCCIGAVFDFYAGTVKRAPQLYINLGLEWLYRLVKEPRRMWKRYLIGNTKFIWYVVKEAVSGNR